MPNQPAQTLVDTVRDLGRQLKRAADTDTLRNQAELTRIAVALERAVRTWEQSEQ